jgi:two-component system chemotaxis family response regulator WspR
MALENARLHQRAQEQSTLDSMTQVYNHGHFIEQVRRAVDQAAKDGTQVSLIMIDIDYFKSYNDTYGHVAGDNVLKLVAVTLKARVKSTDAVGRWGGEEFGVLLPGAGPEDAKKIARRFRRAISDLTTFDGQGHTIPSPTISQGISCYPFPSTCSGELIEQADAALYHAKEQGRDQLALCETPTTPTLVQITTRLHPSQIPAKA